MNLLAFDTSHGDCLVAVLCDGKVIEHKIDTDNSRQAERLLNHIEVTLELSNLSYDKLDAIAVTIGPGSFTGVRIGLAAAKGLRLATKLPIIGVSCLESVAAKAAGKGNDLAILAILAILDAKRGQVYAQLFDKDINALNSP